MKLSRTERWILSNQYRILESLYPHEDYGKARTILEEGYELHYKELAQDIYDGDEVMSEAECREVLDILMMFSHIHFSLERLNEDLEAHSADVTFRGFDGNNEGKYLSYARYFMGLDGGRYPELGTGVVNSHMPILDVYRRQLAAWRPRKNERYLTREDIERIAAAVYARD